jgi:hypothetical protein
VGVTVVPDKEVDMSHFESSQSVLVLPTSVLRRTFCMLMHA